jgi:phosphate acetyltransferase
MFIMTDAAVNIFPTLEDKRDIVQNAIDLARALGVEVPKVGILSAVEVINSKIPSTLDAAALCKMADRGQITGGILDGPLAFDNAISAQAAKTKGITSPVSGDVDILLAPDLESANMLFKQLTYLAGAEGAGIVLGTRIPVVLTSRADSIRTRLASVAVMTLVVQAQRAGKYDVR